MLCSSVEVTTSWNVHEANKHVSFGDFRARPLPQGGFKYKKNIPKFSGREQCLGGDRGRELGRGRRSRANCLARGRLGFRNMPRDNTQRATEATIATRAVRGFHAHLAHSFGVVHSIYVYMCARPQIGQNWPQLHSLRFDDLKINPHGRPLSCRLTSSIASRLNRLRCHG